MVKNNNNEEMTIWKTKEAIENNNEKWKPKWRIIIIMKIM